jgi:hypothetical protein
LISAADSLRQPTLNVASAIFTGTFASSTQFRIYPSH